MVNIVEELRRNGVKLEPVRPRKLSPAKIKRHKQVQKAVRNFIKKMDEISRSTERSVARFRGRATAQYSDRYAQFSKDFQKTRG